MSIKTSHIRADHLLYPPHLQSSHLRPREGKGSAQWGQQVCSTPRTTLDYCEWVDEWMNDIHGGGKQMRLRTSISYSLSHQRGINQSNVFPLIYAPILCAECVSAYMAAHAMPPKVLLCPPTRLPPCPRLVFVHLPGFPFSDSLSFLCSFQGPSSRKTSWIGEAVASHPLKQNCQLSSPCSRHLS